MPNDPSSYFPRVLTVASTLSPRLLRLLQQLDHLGLRQTIVTERVRGSAARRRLGERSLLRPVGLPLSRRFALQSLSAAAHLPALGRRADLVHVHDGDAVTLGLAVATAVIWDIPLIVSARDGSEAATPWPDPIRPALQPVFRAALGRSDLVLAFSKEQAECMVAAGAQAARLRLVAQAEDEPRAAAILGLYRSVWLRHLARQVAIWHPTTG